MKTKIKKFMIIYAYMYVDWWVHECLYMYIHKYRCIGAWEGNVICFQWCILVMKQGKTGKVSKPDDGTVKDWILQYAEQSSGSSEDKSDEEEDPVSCSWYLACNRICFQLHFRCLFYFLFLIMALRAQKTFEVLNTNI